jgi:hypothetical protein
MTKKQLLWDEQGQIACTEHAPYRGSDTWVSGRWRPIRTSERVDFEAEIGRPPECETCAAIARRTAS